LESELEAAHLGVLFEVSHEFVLQSIRFVPLQREGVIAWVWDGREQSLRLARTGTLA
jgi:hypothetical protein